MRHSFGKTVVVALGGSIVYPDGIDAAFLKRFKRFVAPFLKHGTKLILVIGGGKLARHFQDAAGKVTNVTDEDKDWIGIHSTRLNAHLLRTVFREVADPVIVDSRDKVRRPRRPITIAAGWRPGWSTDYVAVRIAADLGARETVIAGKPSHVFNKDHAKFPDAKPISALGWKDYRKLIPRKWKPGLHAPVDPVGAALAARTGIAAIIVDGRNLPNFRNLLNRKEFQGTIIG